MVKKGGEQLDTKFQEVLLSSYAQVQAGFMPLLGSHVQILGVSIKHVGELGAVTSKGHL